MNRRALLASLATASAFGWRAEAQSICVVPPSPDDVNRLLLDTTQLLGVVSGSSDKFSLVQKYMAQRQLVQNYFEKQYPGFTVDWGQLPAQLKAKP
jgi:hypothetical protein